MVDFKAFVEQAVQIVRARRGAGQSVMVGLEVWEHPGIPPARSFVVWDGKTNIRGKSPEECLSLLSQRAETLDDLSEMTVPGVEASLLDAIGKAADEAAPVLPGSVA